MEGILGLFVFVCVLALVIGLIKPSIVVRWGLPEKRTRGKVLLYYGLGLIMLIVLAGIASPPTDIDENPTSVQVNKSEKDDTKSKKEADKLAKVEEKAKAKEEEKAKKEAEAQAKKDAEAKEKEERIKNPDWNVNEVDPFESGNLWLAIDMLHALKQMPEGEWVDPGDIIKTPWNYYGKAITFSGYVGVVEDFPPGSNEDQAGIASDIVIETDDGTIVEFFSMVPSGSIKIDQYVTITGYPIGRTEVENRIGGTYTHLIVVTNNVDQN